MDLGRALELKERAEINLSGTWGTLVWAAEALTELAGKPEEPDWDQIIEVMSDVAYSCRIASEEAAMAIDDLNSIKPVLEEAGLE